MSQFKTPLRYPGGKQKLAPFVYELLVENNLVGGEYAEPYAGGAGVAIELLLNKQVSKIHLNDASRPIYAFWHSILNETEQFCRKIVRASITVPEWKKQKEIFSRPNDVDLFELGFSTFYLNRCNRSGILSAGLIGGLKQSGKWKMDARFPRNDLIARIESIALKKRCIRLRNWDAERFISQYLPRLPKKSLVYCDPPYFKKADRLYLHHYKPEDHKRIAKTIQSNISQPWLVSYDGVPEILDCYSKRNKFLYELQYNASSAYKGSEVIVFSDKLKIPYESSLSYIDAGLATI